MRSFRHAGLKVLLKACLLPSLACFAVLAHIAAAQSPVPTIAAAQSPHRPPPPPMTTPP
jgi:hypothetical protein